MRTSLGKPGSIHVSTIPIKGFGRGRRECGEPGHLMLLRIELIASRERRKRGPS